MFFGLCLVFLQFLLLSSIVGKVPKSLYHVLPSDWWLFGLAREPIAYRIYSSVRVGSGPSSCKPSGYAFARGRTILQHKKQQYHDFVAAESCFPKSVLVPCRSLASALINVSSLIPTNEATLSEALPLRKFRKGLPANIRSLACSSKWVTTQVHVAPPFRNGMPRLMRPFLIRHLA